MTGVECRKAFTQVADDAIVYVKVSGLVNGNAAYRDCKVQRLRTRAGGRNVIHRLPTVTIDGTPLDSPEELDKIKEVNRYKIDDCHDASLSGDPMQLTNLEDYGSDGAPTLGLLDVSDSQWAQLRVHTTTESELQGLPDSWDERTAVYCPNAQAIQDQGECGELHHTVPCSWAHEF
jgi:hypothetical protein